MAHWCNNSPDHFVVVTTGKFVIMSRIKKMKPKTMHLKFCIIENQKKENFKKPTIKPRRILSIFIDVNGMKHMQLPSYYFYYIWYHTAWCSSSTMLCWSWFLNDKFWTGHQFYLTSFGQVTPFTWQVLDRSSVLTDEFWTGHHFYLTSFGQGKQF